MDLLKLGYQNWSITVRRTGGAGGIVRKNLIEDRPGSGWSESDILRTS